MDFLKNVFGDKALTFAEFSQAVEADGKIKLINLADGGYVAKEKLDKKINELSDAQTTITDLKDKLEDAEKVDVKALQDRLKTYEDAENTRKQNEDKAKELEALKARFNPLRKDNKFLNEGTEKWMFDEFTKALALDENKGKSDADIYEAIAKDKNIYENPNQLLRSPQVGGTNSPKGDKAYMDEFYKGNPFYKN